MNKTKDGRRENDRVGGGHGGEIRTWQLNRLARPTLESQACIRRLESTVGRVRRIKWSSLLDKKSLCFS